MRLLAFALTTTLQGFCGLILFFFKPYVFQKLFFFSIFGIIWFVEVYVFDVRILNIHSFFLFSVDTDKFLGREILLKKVCLLRKK